MTATNVSSFEGHSGEALRWALPRCSFWLTFSLTVSTTDMTEKGQCPPLKTNSSTNLDLRRMIHTSQTLEVFVQVRQEAIKRLERRKYGEHNSQREAWHDDEYKVISHRKKRKGFHWSLNHMKKTITAMWVFHQCELMRDKTAIPHLYGCLLLYQSVNLRTGSGPKWE